MPLAPRGRFNEKRNVRALMGYETTEGENRYKKNRSSPVTWDSAKLINGHMLIMGKSGTGKTHTLRKILSEIEANNEGKPYRVHIMDVHGDIEIDGASSVKFSESTSYGFNPLMINPHPDFGGVRKKVQAFIGTINRSGRQLGDKQKAVLRNILIDLYAANGFYENDANSWKLKDGVRTNKKHPTMEDAVRFANAKLKSMFIGASSETVMALEKLYRKQGQFYRKAKKMGTNLSPEDLADIEKEVQKLGTEAVELFSAHIEKIKTGHELTDLMKYDSKDVMKGVVDRLENLNSSGIFRSDLPPFDPRCNIWRYDIRALLPEEKKMFVYFLADALFQTSAQRGIKDDVVEIVVIDEAHLFSDEDGDNPLNVIAKEARKFGLALIAASQSPTHFSDDFLTNVSTKIILGIDESFWDKTVSKMKMPLDALEWIEPHHKMIMQMNQKGSSKNPFIWVELNQ